MQSFRPRPAVTGERRSRWLARRFGDELRLARATAGLTQSQLARLAGVSQPQVSRAERGEGDLSLSQRSRLAAAVGHELSWRLYPIATVRLRDSGQLHLADAIVSGAHGSWRADLEVPVGPGDLRAADIVLSRVDEVIHLEIERVLVDLQAQLRSAQLKRQALAERHQRPVRLVLAVGDTRANRTRLGEVSELLARALPLSSRTVWTAIRTGEPMGADGILIVRPRVRNASPG